MPPRSNSCITCKRRKVKCDEAKPSCERCRKAYMNCEGYKSKDCLVWVNQNDRFGPSRREPSSKSSSSAKTISLANFYPADFDHTWRIPSPIKSPSAELEKMWISYLTTELLPGRCYQDFQGNPTSQSWILDLLDWDCEYVGFNAVCCLSSAFFARMHGSTELLDFKASGQYYLNALRQLRKNIEDPVNQRHPANIASAFLLGIYELTVFENGRGWLQHAGGVGKLIEMRGVESFKEDPARFYFKVSRIPIISQSLIRRKRTFLENPEWQTVSSTIRSPNIRCSYEIVDIMSHIPGLIEDSDSLERIHGSLHYDPQDLAEQTEALKCRIIGVLSQLFKWRWTFESVHPNLAYEVTVNPTKHFTVDDDGVPLYKTIIFFRQFLLGREIALYHTALLMLLNLVKYWHVEAGPAQALSLCNLEMRPEQKSTLLLPNADMSEKHVASEFCRMAEFFLQGKHRMNGSLNMILPFRTLIDLLPEGTQEKKWIMRAMDKMGVGKGFQFLKRIQILN